MIDVTRTIWRGDFKFQGNELVGGTVSEVIGVASKGNVVGKKFSNNVSVIPSSSDSSLSLPSTNSYSLDQFPGTAITTTEGFAQFFPAGWGNDPFNGNLVSVEKSSGNSGSSTGSGGSTSSSQSTTSPVSTATDAAQKEYGVSVSSAKANEGETLTTTISTTGVSTGTALYCQVTGKGINAKDFSSGALKGTLKVGADGTATLAHALKNDNTTEGSESLTVQVFSDKKMKNLVGTGDAVTIADTSVKAVKGSRSSSGATKQPQFHLLPANQQVTLNQQPQK